MSPLRISSLFGALGVALGAFGAHGLRPILESRQTLPVWQTASLYHLLHAIVLLWVSSQTPLPKAAFRFFTAGVLLFSGSLYVLALTSIARLGIITPLGGVALICGWLCLAFRRSKA
ncbi:MAG: hypothetical protein RLZZ142_658 [Verrucomicrobiota bacterium]|jgi:uncharacterized membrane protein YgdD (TMEM256/DUF423 family)